MKIDKNYLAGSPLVIENLEDSNVDIYVDGFPVVESTSGTTSIFPKWCPKGVKLQIFIK